MPVFLPWILARKALRASTDNRYHYIPNVLMRRRSDNRGAWNPAIGCGLDFRGSTHNHDWSPFNGILTARSPAAFASALTARTFLELALIGFLARRLFGQYLPAPWARSAAVAYQLGLPTAAGPSLYPAPTTQALSLLLADLTLTRSGRSAWYLMPVACIVAGLIFLSSHITYAVYVVSGILLAAVPAAWNAPRRNLPPLLRAVAAILLGAIGASPRLIPMLRDLRAARRIQDAGELARTCNSPRRHLAVFIPELFGTQAQASMPICLANGMGIHVQGYPPLYAGSAAAALLVDALVTPARGNRMRILLLVVMAAWRMNLPPVSLLNRILPLFAHPSGAFLVHPLLVLAAFGQGAARDLALAPPSPRARATACIMGAAIIAAAHSSWRRLPGGPVRARLETPIGRFEARQLAIALAAITTTAIPRDGGRGSRAFLALAAFPAVLEGLRSVNLERTAAPTLGDQAALAALGAARFSWTLLLAFQRTISRPLSPALATAWTVADLVPASRTFARIVVNEPFIDSERLYRPPRGMHAWDPAGAPPSGRETDGQLDLDLYRVDRPHLVLGIEPFELASNIPAMHGVRMFGGVNSVFPERTARFYTSFHPDRIPATELQGMMLNESDDDRFLDLVGARYTPGRDGTVRIRPRAIPRFAFFEAWEYESDWERALERLRDPSFDPSTILIVSDSGPVGPGTPREAATAQPLRASWLAPDRARMALPARRRGYAFFGDAGHPGWKARIDEKEVPVRDAHGIFMAVAVTPEDRELEFRFEP